MRKIIKYSDGEVDLSFIYRKKLHHGIYITDKKSDINKNLELSEIKLDKTLNTMVSKRGKNVVVTFKDNVESFQFILTEEYEIGSYRKETSIYKHVLYAENLLKITNAQGLFDSNVLDKKDPKIRSKLKIHIPRSMSEIDKLCAIEAIEKQIEIMPEARDDYFIIFEDGDSYVTQSFPPEHLEANAKKNNHSIADEITMIISGDGVKSEINPNGKGYGRNIND